MITKNDCMSILVKLEDDGLDVNNYIKKLMIAKDIPIEVLKFISDTRGIEANKFYEMLRKKHNQNKSVLYTNIVRDIDNTFDIITTLTSLLTQIGLYSKKIDKPEAFYKEVRAEEIARSLQNFFETSDIAMCSAVLKLVKSDMLVLEYIAGRRDLQ